MSADSVARRLAVIYRRFVTAAKIVRRGRISVGLGSSAFFDRVVRGNEIAPLTMNEVVD